MSSHPMPKQFPLFISILLLCLAVSAFGWAQGTNLSLVNHRSRTATSTPLPIPDGITSTVLDTHELISNAPVRLTGAASNYELTVQFPSYEGAVDIYVALGTKDGKIRLISEEGNPTETHDTLGKGVKTLTGSFGGMGILPSNISAVYWLVAPANGGNLQKSLSSGTYSLTYYMVDVGETDGPEIVMTTPTDVDKISVAWLPVEEAEAYGIHISTDEQFTPDADTLYKTITGERQVEISGLEKNTRYYVTVTAETHSGETLRGMGYGTAITFSEPIKYNEANEFRTSEELNLGNHETEDGILIFKNLPGSTAPPVNSVLFSRDNEGIVLRRVDNVVASGNTLQVETGPASLSDVLEGADVSTRMKIFDVDSAARTKDAQSRLRASRSKAPDGSGHSTVIWDDELLKAEQTNHIHDEEELFIGPGKESNRYNIDLRNSRSASGSVSLDASVNFTPEIETSVKWTGFSRGIESARLVAKGTLGLNIDANYNFNAKASYKPDDKTLFTRRFSSVYMIGTVPVYQRIKLTVKASVSAEAFAKINASASAEISESITIGVTYSSETGQWSPVINNKRTRELEVDISVNGGVNATVRLIPELEVEFYKVVAGTITVEPYLKAELEAEEITKDEKLLVKLAPRIIHPTKFDIKFGLEGFVSAKLDILFKEIKLIDRHQVLSGLEYKFFSLPVLNVIGKSKVEKDKKLKLELQVVDGEGNTFEEGSVKWKVFPEDDSDSATVTKGDCVSVDEAHVCKGTFISGDDGVYNVVVSGNGIIGDIAQQYKVKKVTVEDCYYSVRNESTYIKYCDGITYMQQAPMSINIIGPYNEETQKYEGSVTFQKGYALATGWELQSYGDGDQADMMCMTVMLPHDCPGIDPDDQIYGGCNLPGYCFEGFAIAQRDAGNSIMSGCNMILPSSAQSPVYKSWGACQSALKSRAAFEFPGDCHAWWDREDPDTGEMITCGY